MKVERVIVTTDKGSVCVDGIFAYPPCVPDEPEPGVLPARLVERVNVQLAKLLAYEPEPALVGTQVTFMDTYTSAFQEIISPQSLLDPGTEVDDE